MKIYIFMNLLASITSIFHLKKFLHIYQLKDYNNPRYFKHFLNKKSLIFYLLLICFVLQIIFKLFWLNLALNFILYLSSFISFKKIIHSSKTPPKFTDKLKRLYLISILILFSFVAFQYSFLLIIFSVVLLPPISNFINIYDKIKNKKFIISAKEKLKNHQTKIIAITGSNGKTSVKNILEKMLATQFKTQATPKSFNTPLGISKFINNSLKFNTEFLILEYGARRKKDISKLCKIFGADYGIITTIFPQHLQTFRSIENVFLAKKKLADHLQNKPCVYNIDNIYCKQMFDEKTGEKFSISIHQQANVFANNIKIENLKTQFDLHLNNQTNTLQTSLLGRHNITNICLAVALASFLEVSDENIISTIENLQPVEHRLSLIRTHINILDDSYNCSPASAKEALWVLKNFPGKKMVATPGIIECGKEKYNINFELGREMAFCDFCVIVGNENKQAILDGIKKEIEENNLQPQILFANSLDDSKQYFSHLNHGDTLLLLNDLPDDYK